MNENLNIDELLNAFVDEELSVRHQTEVKRLIDHDPKIAEKLLHIQRCKKLVNSLPAEEAPEHLFDDILAALERNTLLSEPTEHIEQRKGAVQLMIRKVLSAAAMLALIGGLVLVILNVVMPPNDIEPTFVENIPPAIPVLEERVVEKTLPASIVFNGKLELRAEDFDIADGFISKAIAETGLAENCQTSGSHSSGKVFVISCGQKTLKPFLDQLAKGWYQFGSTRLVVASSKQSTIVDSASAEQIMEIASQNDSEKQIKAAKYFAFANNMKHPSSGQILTAKDIDNDFLNIPQPTLTSPQKASGNEGAGMQAEQKIKLVIVLADEL